jgi:Flp pilus assembly protein TadD
MKTRKLSSFALLFALAAPLPIVACGPDKPANTDGVGPTGSASGPATTTSAAPSATVAPASSPDVARGIKLLEDGDFKGARAAFEAAVQKNPKDADAQYYLAVTLEKGGDKAGAEKGYREALKLKPDMDEAAINLAALLVEGEKWDDAIALLRPAVARHGTDAGLHTNLALALAGKGDVAGATTEFEAAVKLTPNDAMLLFTYGHALAVLKQGDAAVAKLKLARDAAGNQADLLAGIGHELLLLRAVPDCIATFDKAIALKDGAPSRTERALCKIAAKDDAGAIADLQAATKAEPNYALAHYWLGTRLGAAKKWADAIKEFEAYLKLEPTGPKAEAAKQGIATAKKGGK